MKNAKFLITLLSVVIVSICLTSCNSCSRDRVKTESADSAYVDVDHTEVNHMEVAFDTYKLPTATFSKGAVWDTWKKLHKACMINAFFKDPTYLGISNTVDIGSVYSKSGDVLEWDFNKLFSEAERKKLINYGQPQPCSYTEQLTVNFEAFIATELPTAGIDGELSTAIKNQKDISVKIDNWQIDHLVKNELKIVLDNSTDPKLIQFKKDLIEKNLIILSQAARINGFSSVINLNSEISAALAARLKEGIVKNIGNTEAKLKFEYSSAKQIKVTSQGSFIVFAEFIKTKKVYANKEK